MEKVSISLLFVINYNDSTLLLYSPSKFSFVLTILTIKEPPSSSSIIPE